MSSLKILSGGAAQGLVASLGSEFKARTGLDIAGEFGAVGSMADKLRNGTPTDLVILTAALVASLAEDKLLVASSIADIGKVETTLAVRNGDPKVSISNASDLRAAFLAADAIFVPDTEASTAGIHVAKLLQQLDIADAVVARLQVYPNGATAMRHLAASEAARPIGCTQSTEIISTPGVALSGSLPPGCDLATTYTAAIAKQADNPAQAAMLIELLTSRDQQTRRDRAGFLS
ncbi:substrate-binding domain-containing protein [Bradyrhizobium sp. ARR65]|uniref:molybdate ABC transporter substrate-binding protein n=1 Tax=Bradyrhizobium sp. ARR65 TaxID=1040989 RepID=UPI000465CD0A|nr:substrate-binding domain-containing protein [Bradyrhizobium sp. ARR65]